MLQVLPGALDRVEVGGRTAAVARRAHPGPRHSPGNP
jgi:hypothetical protein